MKTFKLLLASIAISLGLAAAAGAEETMTKMSDATKKVASKTVSGAKTGWTRGKRVGHTVGDKTWNGSKWVASSSYRGGKWVAVKSKNGTKWVYRKGKGVFTGTKRKIA